ncbi:hypothetical protein M9H77_22453 [Catharanthus roseus]|uniref:Uncharacterized protein n=1 Tax=Catharanthus roseus TaxID=4058 RepID=A0ACC0AQI2_CATRO|nr:hypothetical protein M9H77_22453 [Catharanthus roseus]
MKKIEVLFDKDGEPIGENAASFSEFLRTQVGSGKDISIDIIDWCLVPEDNKLELLNVVKLKSEKNKQIRACNKMSHWVGKKSFARILKELVRTSAMLKSFNDPTETAAKGYLVSMDLGKQVVGLPLGPNFYEVNMQVAVVRDEYLLLPLDLFDTIGDALGISIAWPKKLVVREPFS